MNKKQPQKQEPKQEQKPKESVFPTFEDFFTKFLEKRKGYFVTKLEQIEKLEKLDQSKLQPEQVQKINNKADTLEKMKYFDDIKSLYFESAAKRTENAVAEPAEAKPSLSREGTIADIVNLLSVGQAIHNFEHNSTSFEHFFDSEQMITVQEAFSSVSSLKTPADIENSKAMLANCCANEQLQKSVKLFLEATKSGEHRRPDTHSHREDKAKATHKEAHHEAHKDAHKDAHHEAHKVVH